MGLPLFQLLLVGAPLSLYQLEMIYLDISQAANQWDLTVSSLMVFAQLVSAALGLTEVITSLIVGTKYGLVSVDEILFGAALYWLIA